MPRFWGKQQGTIPRDGSQCALSAPSCNSLAVAAPGSSDITPIPRNWLAPSSRFETPIRESDVAHLRTDVDHIKTDVRSLRDWAEARFERLETKLDARFDKLDARFHKVDARFDKVDARFERVDARLDAVTHTIAAAQVWAVLLYVALAAGTFGTMARAFGWL